MNNNFTVAFSKTMLAIGIASASTAIQAGSFGLFEQSASGQGVAYAGAAAIAEDAATIYFNPAGMTRLSGSQIVVAGHIVATEAKYTDAGSRIVIDAAGNTAPLSGSNSSSDETGFIPNFYYFTELGNGVFAGVGVNVPFGLATEYDNGWYGRYHSLKSEITSININPSIAWKVTDKISVGFGVSIQYLDLEITNNVESNGACGSVQSAATKLGLAIPSCAGITGDSHLKMDGDSTEMGWNAGILINMDDKSRIGLAYRSAIKHEVSGNSSYTLDPVLGSAAASVSQPNSPYNILQNTSLSAAAELPDSFAVSYVRDIDSRWTVLADWTWTGWSSLDRITILQTGDVPGNERGLDLAYANTNRYSVGAHFKPDNKWTYRGGLAYDETPIRSPEQTSPRIPGNDRIWLSVGLGYAPAASWSLDFGYTHFVVDNAKINNGPSAESSGAILIGEFEPSVDIYSAQVNFNF